MTDRPRGRYIATAVVAVLALAVGLLGPWVWGLISGPSAKDKIESDPPPALFSAAAVTPVDALVDPQGAKAHQLMKAYWATHGRTADDKAFVAWLGGHFPAPPKQRTAEMRALETVKKRRTDAGVIAATWLEAHGKKDIWKLYAHDQAEWLPARDGDARKADVKAMLKMSSKASDAVARRYPSSAPYVLDRGLLDSRSKDHDPIDKLKSEKRPCPCSYPSRHAAKAAAARMYLTAAQPRMAAQYRWMEDEIDWSRIYMAGHMPSDISGGALLGDMIGEYFLVTRDHPAPATTQ
jgi:hypothetical protein